MKLDHGEKNFLAQVVESALASKNDALKIQERMEFIKESENIDEFYSFFSSCTLRKYFFFTLGSFKDNPSYAFAPNGQLLSTDKFPHCLACGYQ